MAYNTPWTPEEEQDTRLGWEAFHQKWPARSYHAWRIRRREVDEKRTPATSEKPRPQPIATPSAAPWPDANLEVSDRELFDAVLSYQRTIERAFPHKIEHAVRLDVSEPIAVCFPADWHIGSEGTDLARLRRDCELIASHPRLYCALGGDVVDNFVLAKMVEATRSMVAQPVVQWRLFRYLVSLILDSLLWVSSGNHDAWTVKAAGIDGVPLALKDLPVVPIYTAEGGFIDLTVGTQTYTVWRKHRPRYNSNFNRTHGHKQMLMRFLPREADILVTEHFHEAGLEVIEYRRKQRVLINTGTYKVLDRYAEAGGFYSGGYGVPTCILYPDRRKILPMWSIEDALEALDGPSLAA